MARSRVKKPSDIECAPPIFVDADSPLGQEVEKAVEAMAARAALREERETLDMIAFELCELTGLHCADCGKPQRMTPSGATCGEHGGATSLEETRGSIPTGGNAKRGKRASKLDGIVMHHHTEKQRDNELAPGLSVAFIVDAKGAFTTLEPPAPSDKPPVYEVLAEVPLGPLGIFDGKVWDEVAKAATTYVNRGRAGTLRFVETETRALLEIVDAERVLRGPRIDGALVKLAPTIKASERESFDGIGLKTRLLEHGASSVTIAPRIVSDAGVTKRARVAAAKAMTPDEAVREYFAGMTGLAPDEIEEAIALAVELVQDA